jgi:hypothetical protein
MVGIGEREVDFLSKAQEAEAEAARASVAKTKASWLKIAAGYRRLAEQAVVLQGYGNAFTE